MFKSIYQKPFRNRAVLILSCFSISLFLVSLNQVNAAPPVPFDNWTENAGTISAPCPINFECRDGVKDDGILQRTLLAPSGEQYVQLIVLGVDQLGTMTTDESIIRMNTVGLNGISAKQTLNQSGVDQLASETLLNTGWANDGLTPAVSLTQSLISSFQGVDYSDNFSYMENRDLDGNKTGSFTDINQTILNSSLLSATPTTGQDVQTFVFRRASGVYNPNSGQATLQGTMGGMGGMDGMGGGMMGGGAGGTVNWNAGDDVQVVWIGALCEGCGDGGMMGGGGGGMGGGGMGGGGAFDVTFSYQSFDNLVDAQDPIATASIVSVDPFTWPDPPFGLQPTL